MPHTRREPVSESEMEFASPDCQMEETRYLGHHTICQTLREIYWDTDDVTIKDRCRLAMAMAKAMNDKLVEYRAWFEAHPDVERPVRKMR